MNEKYRSKEEIIFVYNADSGPLNSIKDFTWRIASPDTYPSNLCAVTYSNFGMKDEWREFTKGLDQKVEFLHRDEFRERYGEKGYQFPASFVRTDSSLELLISSEEMNECDDLEEMIELVESKLDGLED